MQLCMQDNAKGSRDTTVPLPIKDIRKQSKILVPKRNGKFLTFSSIEKNFLPKADTRHACVVSL